MKIRMDWSRSLVIESHGLTMCRTKRWATFEGRGIELSRGETELLWLLVVSGGTWGTRDLGEYLYSEDEDGGPLYMDNIIRAFVMRIRHKLGLRVIRTKGHTYYFAGNLEDIFADDYWPTSPRDAFKYVPNRTQHEIATAD
jgi:DNA-binding response OmpR family regulator